mgnify:FL=1|jgi:hypothetical protein|tara:strand:- start:173 stop:838 length:666 start_codon:yes stop_codon:yes gene_type:complete
MTQIIDLFATPVIAFKFEKHDEYVTKWQNWEKEDNTPEGWNCSLYTSFPNVKSNDPKIPKDLISNLKEDLLFNIKKTLLKHRLSERLKYQTFWYNAYYQGQNQEPHNHLLSPAQGIPPTWSGVYFAKNCLPKQFRFHRADLSLWTQNMFNVSKSPLEKYYEPRHDTVFSDGDVILFPPHVRHSVKVTEPLNVDNQRLTFAFNLDNYYTESYEQQVIRSYRT